MLKTGIIAIQEILPNTVDYQNVVWSCHNKMMKYLEEIIFTKRSITIRDLGIEASPYFNSFQGSPSYISYTHEMRVGLANPEEAEVGEHTFMDAPLDMKTLMLISGKMFVREEKDLWKRIG